MKVSADVDVFRVQLERVVQGAVSVILMKRAAHLVINKHPAFPIRDDVPQGDARELDVAQKGSIAGIDHDPLVDHIRHQNAPIPGHLLDSGPVGASPRPDAHAQLPLAPAIFQDPVGH